MEILRITASANAISGARATRVLGFWLEAGVDAATALVYNAATATGTVKFSAKAPAADDRGVIFPQPILMDEGVSVTLSGTNPAFHLMVE